MASACNLYLVREAGVEGFKSIRVVKGEIILIHFVV